MKFLIFQKKEKNKHGAYVLAFQNFMNGVSINVMNIFRYFKELFGLNSYFSK